MNVFKQMIWSVAGVKKYPILMKLRAGRCVRYMLFLTFIYAFCLTVVPGTRFLAEAGGLHAIIDEYVPEFQLKDGVLTMEETYNLDENGLLVFVDTEYAWLSEYSSDDIYSLANNYEGVLLIDSEGWVVKSNREVNATSFKQLGLECSKSDLHGWVKYVYVIMGIVLLLAWLGSAFTFLFGALFVALAGMIIKSVLRVNITFGQVFKLSVYAKTLMVLIKAVIAAFWVVFGGYAYLSFAVSVVWLFVAMKRIQRSDAV